MFRCRGLAGRCHERGPAAVFRHSRARAGGYPREHLAGYAGMQAEAFAGYNGLYHANGNPPRSSRQPVGAHGSRYVFDLAKLAKAPIAAGAVRRIGELFEIERAINGKTPEQRVAVRHEKSKPLAADLEA